MVLGDNHDTFKSTRLCSADYLFSVELRWIEYFRILVAESPFLIGISIRAKVNNTVHPRFLPLQLAF